MGVLLDVLHLTAWGQLGVLIRYYLGRLYGTGCTQGSSWLPCVTSPGLIRPGGALFTDLPANVAGSVIMGFLSPADLLLLGRTPPAPTEEEKGSATSWMPIPQPAQKSGAIQPGLPCAALPQNSPIQKHTSLLLGLRTGLCGCTTTFASWMLQMVYMIVGTSPSGHKAGTEWFTALSGLVLGCLVAQASLAVGQQMARTAAGFWHRHAATEAARQQQQQAAAAGTGVAVDATSSNRTNKQNQLEAAGAAQPTLDGSGPAGLVRLDVQPQPVTARSHPSSPNPQLFIVLPSALDPITPDATLDPTIPAHDPSQHNASLHSSASQTETKRPSPRGQEQTGAGLLCTACDAAAMVVTLVLSIVSIVLIAVAASHDDDEDVIGRRDFVLWVSLLLSPVGCLLRWRLSALNQRAADRSRWTWFPLGTWLANMGGCLIDYAMAVATLRSPGLSALSSATLSGVETGLGGSLSTVSTWVVELQRLGVHAHEDTRSLTYLMTSLTPAVALGLLVYGTAAWTMD